MWVQHAAPPACWHALHAYTFCSRLSLQVWDAKTTPNPNLGGIADTVLGVYTGATFKTDIGDLPFKSAVHVEAIVGQVDGGYKLDVVGETKWVMENAKMLAPIKVGIVPFVHLGRDDAAETIAAHRALAGSAFVGVRMILNFDPKDESICWPQVGRDDYLQGKVPAFTEK
jgi:hypothetical protein